MCGNIISNTAPEQRNRAAGSIGWQNAGSAKLEHLTIHTARTKHIGQVKLLSRIKPLAVQEAVLAEQAIGAHNSGRLVCHVINHKKVIAQIVIRIAIKTYAHA
jgi:hypothetical protein